MPACQRFDTSLGDKPLYSDGDPKSVTLLRPPLPTDAFITGKEGTDLAPKTSCRLTSNEKAIVALQRKSPRPGGHIVCCVFFWRFSRQKSKAKSAKSGRMPTSVSVEPSATTAAATAEAKATTAC
mmetsp:Transcript_11293/g.24887  ORF Transcript_11293/g.24887 Transcript_11293/m.24887 type:complete len:125 (-) Transcript_11293:103-477(-)